jgi:replicative DNA helicase
MIDPEPKQRPIKMGQPNLTDEHRDPQLERRVLASLSQDPDLYWELGPREELFPACEQAFQDLSGAIRAGEDVPGVPDDWAPAEDPEAALKRLRSAWKRRETAAVQEVLAGAIGGQRPIGDAVAAAGERLAEIEGELRRGGAGTLRENSDVVSEMLDEAEEAREHYQATDDEIRGVKTGISRLDEITGGLKGGLTALAGPPGVGKTSLALQIAADAAGSGTPVVYVTFENSPKQLARKGTGAAGNLNPREIKRGTVPLKKTRQAAVEWEKRAERVAYVKGNAELEPGDVRAKAKRHMAQHGTDRCLIVADYLQLWAKAARYLRGLGELREKVQTMGNDLTELGRRLDSPVLGVASQPRSAYEGDKARDDLSTLKESGDLEYSADVVAVLTEDPDRQATDPAVATTLNVAKHRNGETGRVELIFRPDRGTMRPEAAHGDPSQNGVPQADSAVF